jgi:hypothetical protein
MAKWSHIRNGSASWAGIVDGKAWFTVLSSPNGLAVPALATRITLIVSRADAELKALRRVKRADRIYFPCTNGPAG